MLPLVFKFLVSILRMEFVSSKFIVEYGKKFLSYYLGIWGDIKNIDTTNITLA